MTFVACCISYILWSAWWLVGGGILPPAPAAAFVVDTAVKTIIWLGPMLAFLPQKNTCWFLSPRRMFSAPFPWLPTLAGLCLTVAFLHTLRIAVVGIHIYGIFDPMWIYMSFSAAVIEELVFRGLLFNRQAADFGTFKAALMNAVIFALYHFPEFLLGQGLGAIFGIRFWVCACMGFVFSIVFAQWKHLGMNMVIHFAWNMLCYFFALS